MAKTTRRIPELQLGERLREWVRAPKEKALREQARRLALKVDLTPPKAKSKKTRKTGGGRNLALTQEQITRLQEVFRRELDKDAKLKTYTMAAQRLRRLLPKDAAMKRSLRTLIRHVFKPVLAERTK
jgi:hypothetical protein